MAYAPITKPVGCGCAALCRLFRDTGSVPMPGKPPERRLQAKLPAPQAMR